ncbi:hypothetical protein J2X36_001960 [Methylobacterium sp. BE186]|nr:hypothetical protein [Methylobacterium sp. BE186]
MGEASASLMNVMETIPTAIAATRDTAESNAASGVSMLAIAMIATV